LLEAEIEKTMKNGIASPLQEVDYPDPYFYNELGKRCWRCPQCSKEWNPEDNVCNGILDNIMGSRKTYKQHVLEEHRGLFYRCPLCSKGVKLKHDFCCHLVKNHSARLAGDTHEYFLCQNKKESGDVCQFKDNIKSQMIAHLKKVHFQNLQEKYPCEICGQQYNCKFYLIQHKKRVHSKTEQFLCSTCGRVFLSKTQQKKHERQMHTPLTLTCSQCPPGKDNQKKKYNQHTLKGHQKSVHKKKWQCTKCGFMDLGKQDLYQHFRIKHMNYLQYQCSQCGKQFGERQNAKYHYQTVHFKITERKIIAKLFEKNKDAIINRKETEPESYPNDDSIKGLLGV
jgi:hypothetical protein